MTEFEDININDLIEQTQNMIIENNDSMTNVLASTNRLIHEINKITNIPMNASTVKIYNAFSQNAIAILCKLQKDTQALKYECPVEEYQKLIGEINYNLDNSITKLDALVENVNNLRNS